MTHSHLGLSSGNLSAELIPGEGGVLASFRKSGFELLGKTPWAAKVGSWSIPAEDEPTWVSRWRGGWQLCAPSTGEADPLSPEPAFHGAASQANWQVVSNDSIQASLEWVDKAGIFSITRSWILEPPNRIRAVSTLRNNSQQVQRYGVAEHLILGSDFLKPCLDGEEAHLDFSSEAQAVELDYAGFQTGRVTKNAANDSQWNSCALDQPARVFALTNLLDKKISVSIGNRSVLVEWSIFPNALIWQEFGTSDQAPWNSEVFALGIEPTSTPHGAGLQAADSPIIEPQQIIQWETSLSFQD